MRHVSLAVLAPDLGPQAAYDRISDFARYPQLTSAVREVTLHPTGDADSVVSDWSVNFRKGVLRWTERDTFDPARLVISFEQLRGDFASFRGTWEVFGTAAGTLVRFEAAFDLGIPTLAPIIDPVAESTLRGNILLILDGLLGTAVPVPAGDERPAGIAGVAAERVLLAAGQAPGHG